MHDPDELETIRSARSRFDDEPVAITHYQMMKVGAIVDAAGRGHAGYFDELAHVARFLQVRAMESTLHQDHLAEQRAAAWQRLDSLPWPPNGQPRPQQL